MELRQLLDWHASDSGVWLLKGLKLQPGPASYLLHDGRKLSTIRARLRLNRCSLNASLAERRITGDPNCDVCQVPETVEHCLLVCPRYAAPRQQCTSALNLLGLQPNLAVLLGADESCPTNSLRPTLIATGIFLLAVDALRRL